MAVPAPGLSRPGGDTAGFTFPTWIYSSLQTWFTALREILTLLIVHDSLITSTKMVFRPDSGASETAKCALYFCGLSGR